MENKIWNFLLAGVGGQGTLLASDIVAEVGIHIGLDAKKSEVHGMAQRGGAVVSHVRWGEKIASPLIKKGDVDYFVAQEMLESVRWLEYLRKGGTVILNHQQLPPTSTIFGKDVYPDDSKVISTIGEIAGKVLKLDAAKIAEELGNVRTANTVLLGALSQVLEVPAEKWLDVVEAKVPQRHREINRKAFLTGREGQWEYVREEA